MNRHQQKATADIPRVAIYIGYINVSDITNWSAYGSATVSSSNNVDLASMVKEDAQRYERSWRALAQK